MHVRLIALLAFVHTTLASIFTVSNQNNTVTVTTSVGGFNGTRSKNYTVLEARRAAKKYQSTSSSSAEAMDNDQKSADSLGIEESSSEVLTDSNEKAIKWTREELGWRKWHRKCNPCPEDMVKKWRDPSIQWICAGYQRARRTFKSECMMFYRNCQDGTMFTKIHDHRCNEKSPGYNGGRHFFYDYPVKLRDESSSSGDTETAPSSSDPDSTSTELDKSAV